MRKAFEGTWSYEAATSTKVEYGLEEEDDSDAEVIGTAAENLVIAMEDLGLEGSMKFLEGKKDL